MEIDTYFKYHVKLPISARCRDRCMTVGPSDRMVSEAQAAGMLAY